MVSNAGFRTRTGVSNRGSRTTSVLEQMVSNREVGSGTPKGVSNKGREGLEQEGGGLKQGRSRTSGLRTIKRESGTKVNKGSTTPKWVSNEGGVSNKHRGSRPFKGASNRRSRTRGGLEQRVSHTELVLEQEVLFCGFGASFKLTSCYG